MKSSHSCQAQRRVRWGDQMVTKAEGNRKGFVKEVECGQSFVKRVGVGVMF